MFEVSTASSKLQHRPPVTLFEKSLAALSIGPCGRLLQIRPNLKRFLEFGACFWLCFKLAVILQHCPSHAIDHWVYIRRIWRPLVFCDEIWTAGPQPVLCAARRCALCVLTSDCNPGIEIEFSIPGFANEKVVILGSRFGIKLTDWSLFWYLQ